MKSKINIFRWALLIILSNGLNSFASETGNKAPSGILKDLSEYEINVVFSESDETCYTFYFSQEGEVSKQYDGILTFSSELNYNGQEETCDFVGLGNFLTITNLCVAGNRVQFCCDIRSSNFKGWDDFDIYSEHNHSFLMTIRVPDVQARSYRGVVDCEFGEWKTISAPMKGQNLYFKFRVKKRGSVPESSNF